MSRTLLESLEILHDQVPQRQTPPVQQTLRDLRIERSFRIAEHVDRVTERLDRFIAAHRAKTPMLLTPMAASARPLGQGTAVIEFPPTPEQFVCAKLSPEGIEALANLWKLNPEDPDYWEHLELIAEWY